MKWHKFFRLTWEDKLLFLRIAILLVTTRIGLALLPYRTLLGLFGRVSTIPEPQTDPTENHEYVKRVKTLATVAGKRVLGSKPCLPQALVVEHLLKRHGLDASLEIGVTKDSDGQFLAHAWVECHGDVVIGGRLSPSRYSRLKSHKPEIH